MTVTVLIRPDADTFLLVRVVDVPSIEAAIAEFEDPKEVVIAIPGDHLDSIVYGRCYADCHNAELAAKYGGEK